MIRRASLLVPTLAVLSVTAVIATPVVANAQTAALSFTGGSGQFFPNYTVGWSFTVINPISVQSLGWFDAGSDGFLNSHDVGIFSSSGTLLTAATVTTTDNLVNGFRYTSITPFTLTTGTYVVAGTTGNDLFQAFCTGVTTDPNITFGNGGFIGPGINTLTFPTQASDRGLAYFGPNFLIGSTSAPEPGTLPILMSAAFVLVGPLLRRRK